jgi:multidrug resistance efflux pump
VVAINTRVGETAAQYPLIELADVSEIICEAEVVETDAALIAPGQIVKITSPALPQELHGKVLRRGQLVGRPQLAVADPLAKADYRSILVAIEIDSADVPIASKWLQLQVSVEIVVASDDASGEPATNADAPQP